MEQTKIVAQLDAEGFFVGPAVADMSPLEPEVWLVPGGAVDAPPPDIPEGMWAKWTGSGWQMVEATLPPASPPTPVASVSRFQALAALMHAGLLADVTAWSNDPATDPLHKLAFDTATEFSRTSPTLAAGAAVLGWNEGQLDDFFAAAAQIQA
ncbi:hypothetical protein D9M72_526630 [compost metagenome]